MNYETRILTDIQIKDAYNASVDYVALEDKQALDLSHERNIIANSTMLDIKNQMAGMKHENRIEYLNYVRNRIEKDYSTGAQNKDLTLRVLASCCAMNFFETAFLSETTNELITLANKYISNDESMKFINNLSDDEKFSAKEKINKLADRIRTIALESNASTDENLLDFIEAEENNATKRFRQKTDNLATDAHIINACKVIKSLTKDLFNSVEEEKTM